MISTHRLLNTWRTQVDAFIALSDYAKQKFVEGGVPSNKIFVKPNFVEETARPTTLPSASNVILFVGRLSDEKGVDLLLRAWREARQTGAGVLRIIGDGPLRHKLQSQSVEYGFKSTEVQFAGTLPYQEVMDEIGKARALVLPSLCFENCPRTLIEAFCNGRPVLVPNSGSLNEMVVHDVTGLKFTSGDEASLAHGILTLLSPSAPVDTWGEGARLEYFSKYTPSTNFESLMRIYRFAARKHTAPSDTLVLSATAGEFF
jgi:glycosyltransferase involved in cell wall biosynthesis